MKKIEGEREREFIEVIKNETRRFSDKNEFIDFASHIDDLNKYEFVTFEDMKFNKDGTFDVKKNGKTKSYKFTESGLNTLLKTFGMPVDFYMNKAPSDMLIRDLNRMKATYSSDSEVRVCFKEDTIKGVMRPTISVVKNKSIASSLLNSPFEFKFADMDDYGMRITNAGSSLAPDIKVQKGDIVSCGVDATYSDIANTKTALTPFLMRLVCTNGMVLQDKNNSYLPHSVFMPLAYKQSKKVYLQNYQDAIKEIIIDTSYVSKALKAMREHPISDIEKGEPLAKKIRNSLTPKIFDEIDGLIVKVMNQDTNRESREINTDYLLYDFLDKATRLARDQVQMRRRLTESYAGLLISESGKAFA